MFKESLYSEAFEHESQLCLLCPHFCSILSSRRGACGVRINKDGNLYTDIYGKITVCDPHFIEEIPIYHYNPGVKVMLTGFVGCNMRCPFCNTFVYSQIGGAKFDFLMPDELVKKCKDADIKGIIFGITEPIVNFEYLLETIMKSKDGGLFTGICTNALINPKALADIMEYTDIFLVGVKSWDEDYLLRKCGGKFREIMINIETLLKSNAHVEISYLLIPDETDKPEILEQFFSWLKSIKQNVPLHLISYETAYQYSIPSIPLKKLIPIYEKAKNYLPFVYTSNVSNQKMNQTVCPRCKSIALDRSSGRLISSKLNHAKQCGNCGESLNII